MECKEGIEPSFTGWKPVILAFIRLAHMVGGVRFELTTYQLKVGYSDQLSYTPIWCAGLESNQRCFSVTDLQSAVLATRHTHACFFWWRCWGSNPGPKHFRMRPYTLSKPFHPHRRRIIFTLAAPHERQTT